MREPEGIETTYKMICEIRPKTHSKNPTVWFLLFSYLLWSTTAGVIVCVLLYREMGLHVDKRISLATLQHIKNVLLLRMAKYIILPEPPPAVLS